jgi:arylsulfatase A-like enzyme
LHQPDPGLNGAPAWPGRARSPRLPRGPRRAVSLLALGLVAISFLALAGTRCVDRRAGQRPNVLWIMWDTVRADRLSLYGHTCPTTPFLDQWAKEARVFDNVLTVASTTVPAHASLFTGLLPCEHGADNTHCYLRDNFETLAEIFHANGYSTFLYSENPLISRETGFGQGFDDVVNPWNEAYRYRAATILENKIPAQIRNPQLAAKLRSPGITHWALSACGILGEETLLEWLGRSDSGRPFFVFMNYMEAHAPVITPRHYRERMLNPAQVMQSYTMGVTPATIWQYTFGLKEYSPAELEAIRGTYDASLAELDDLLSSLLARLKERGALKNTIVILCGDHGEFLGEHHALDHEYSLYQELLRVPLVLYYPPKVRPGRETQPVQNIDLYTTILDLAGLSATGETGSASLDLRNPDPKRVRLSEFPTAPEPPFDEARAVQPRFDPTPYRRSLRAIIDGDQKLIRASDGRNELFSLAVDSTESNNLWAERPELAAALSDRLDQILAEHAPRAETPAAGPVTEEQKEVLRSLGYIGGKRSEADSIRASAGDTGRGKQPAIRP